MSGFCIKTVTGEYPARKKIGKRCERRGTGMNLYFSGYALLPEKQLIDLKRVRSFSAGKKHPHGCQPPAAFLFTVRNRVVSQSEKNFSESQKKISQSQTHCFTVTNRAVSQSETKCFAVRNKVFQLYETECFNRLKHSAGRRRLFFGSADAAAVFRKTVR